MSGRIAGSCRAGKCQSNSFHAQNLLSTEAQDTTPVCVLPPSPVGLTSVVIPPFLRVLRALCGSKPAFQPLTAVSACPWTTPGCPGTIAGCPGIISGCPGTIPGCHVIIPGCPRSITGGPGTIQGCPGIIQGYPGTIPGCPGTFPGCPGRFPGCAAQGPAPRPRFLDPLIPKSLNPLITGCPGRWLTGPLSPATLGTHAGTNGLR